MILPIMCPNPDDLSIIVDSDRPDQLPFSGAVLEQLVQVVKPMVAIQKAVEVLVSGGQRTSYDVTLVINVAGNAEGTTQRPQRGAFPLFLEKRLHAPSFVDGSQTGIPQMGYFPGRFSAKLWQGCGVCLEEFWR